MRSLPADVIEEIMSKLPTKHILQCKILSKSFYALIKSPGFLSKHRANNIMVGVKKPGIYTRHWHNKNSQIRCKKQPIDIVVPLLSPAAANEEDEESRVYIPPSHTEKRLSLFLMVGSCNGLLCANELDDHTVWNPATREYVNLPPLNLQHKVSGYHHHALGFGYDARSNDYKFVKIVEYYQLEENNQRCDSSLFVAQVCSMNRNCWNDIGTPALDLSSEFKVYQFCPRVGLYLKGNLYWVAIAKDESGVDPVLFSFDTSDDTFRKVPLPGDIVAHQQVRRRSLTINDFMGTLALFVGYSQPSYRDQIMFDIWVMEDDHDDGGWTKRFSIGPFSQEIKPTPVSINGCFLMEYKCPYYGDRSKFIFYDPVHNKEHDKESPLSVRNKRFIPWSFSESVVPVQNTKRTRLF